MNISTHYIEIIEIDKKFPSPEMIGKLTDTLGIKPSQLFSKEVVPLEAVMQFLRAMLKDINGLVGRFTQGEIKDLEE